MAIDEHISAQTTLAVEGVVPAAPCTSGKAGLPGDHTQLILEATWELEGLLVLLIEQIGGAAEHLAKRGVAIRALALTDSIMAICDGEHPRLAKVAHTVHGPLPAWPEWLKEAAARG